MAPKEKSENKKSKKDKDEKIDSVEEKKKKKKKNKKAKRSKGLKLFDEDIGSDIEIDEELDEELVEEDESENEKKDGSDTVVEETGGKREKEKDVFIDREDVLDNPRFLEFLGKKNFKLLKAFVSKSESESLDVEENMELSYTLYVFQEKSEEIRNETYEQKIERVRNLVERNTSDVKRFEEKLKEWKKKLKDADEVEKPDIKKQILSIPEQIKSKRVIIEQNEEFLKKSYREMIEYEIENLRQRMSTAVVESYIEAHKEETINWIWEVCNHGGKNAGYEVLAEAEVKYERVLIRQLTKPKGTKIKAKRNKDKNSMPHHSHHHHDEQPVCASAICWPVIIFVIIAIIVMIGILTTTRMDSTTKSWSFFSTLVVALIWIGILWMFCRAGQHAIAWFLLMLPIAVGIFWYISVFLAGATAPSHCVANGVDLSLPTAKKMM